MTTALIKDSELKSLVNFAERLADVAAETTLPYFRTVLPVENKDSNDFDPVTIADRSAEQKMRNLIEEYFPAHGIVGEEYGATEGESELTWVLDPIDGTRAFISGLPVWGTLIALSDSSRCILGVMDQPFTQERFIGSGERSVCVHRGVESDLSTRQCSKLADAIMMSTAPDMFDATEFAAQQELAGQVKLMRYGADCYGYCMLASGHVDLVVEAGLSPYDIQALIPIVENAGGIVTDWQGASAMQGGQVVAAATPALHTQALSMLYSACRKSNNTL